MDMFYKTRIMFFVPLMFSALLAQGGLAIKADNAQVQEDESVKINVLRNDNIGQLIEQFENTLSEHQALNFKKWPLMGKKIWPNKHKSQSHKEELDLLKIWIEQRLIWLDQQWGMNATE